MKKKLIVCGDSYLSPRTRYPNKHCTEIFASRLNFELTIFARSAMSNGGIALQLMQAIEERPDLIIFNLTFSDRIEFPLGRLSNSHRVTHANLHRSYKSDELSLLNGKAGNFVSDNLLDLLEPNNRIYPVEKYDAIKSYFNELYSHSWKHQTDCMMMYSIMHVLHLSNIDYILFLDKLCMEQTPFKMSWLSQKYDLSEEVKTLLDTPVEDPNYVDPGFHSPLEIQERLADVLIDHYNKYF
jgi:hypothetical protein